MTSIHCTCCVYIMCTKIILRCDNTYGMSIKTEALVKEVPTRSQCHCLHAKVRRCFQPVTVFTDEYFVGCGDETLSLCDMWQGVHKERKPSEPHRDTSHRSEHARCHSEASETQRIYQHSKATASCYRSRLPRQDANGEPHRTDEDEKEDPGGIWG